MTSKTCTSMDHIFPYPKWGEIKKGTPCYCGQSKWGIEKKGTK